MHYRFCIRFNPEKLVLEDIFLFLHPFNVNVSFLYLLKTPEKERYIKRMCAWVYLLKNSIKVFDKEQLWRGEEEQKYTVSPIKMIFLFLSYYCPAEHFLFVKEFRIKTFPGPYLPAFIMNAKFYFTIALTQVCVKYICVYIRYWVINRHKNLVL